VPRRDRQRKTARRTAIQRTVDLEKQKRFRLELEKEYRDISKIRAATAVCSFFLYIQLPLIPHKYPSYYYTWHVFSIVIILLMASVLVSLAFSLFQQLSYFEWPLERRIAISKRMIVLNTIGAAVAFWASLKSDL